MKKMLAILLALLMITAAAASAESAFTFADPVLTMNMGETQTFDLTGFEIEIAAGQVGNVVAARVNLSGDGRKMLTLNANVVGSRVVLGIEGVSKTFYADIPEAAANVTSMDLSGLDIDVEALVAPLLSSIEMDGDTIRIPYTAVNDVLEVLAPAIEKVEIPGVDVSQVSSMIAQLKQSNSGVNLEGSYSQSENGMSVSATVIPVMNGQAGDAVLNVNFDMDDAGLMAMVEVPGQFKGHFGAEPVDDSKAKISIGGEANGASVELTGVAGIGESDAELVLLDADNAISFEKLTDGSDQALMAELMGAAGGLIQYIYGVIGAAA